MKASEIAAVAGGLGAAALMVAILHGPMGWAIAGLILLPTLARAWVAARDSRRRAKEAADHYREAIELRLITLAKAHRGELTATAAAEALGIAPAAADRFLTGMADGTRVSVEVDAEGIVRYVFREVIAALPQIRVENEESPIEEDAESAKQDRAET